MTRNEWRKVGRFFMQALLVLLIIGTVNFATASTSTAQSQDYINGMMAEQNKALSDRVGNLEKVLYFVLAATFGVLITNIMGLRNQGIDRKQNRSDHQRQPHRPIIYPGED